MKERNILLDSLKGFAIMMVVLGHSIQLNQYNFDSNPLFKIIYSFHMPLFMFISGFLSFKIFDGSVKKLLKRFNSLVVPFVAWFLFSFVFGCLMFIFRGGEVPVFLSELKNLIKSPEHGLWFLWVLFLNYVVLFFALKVSKKYEDFFIFFVLIVVNILIRLFPESNYLGLGAVAWYLFFYLIGYISNKYFINVKGLLKIVGILSLCTFPFLVLFWSRINPPAFLEYISIGATTKEILFIVYKLITPITGIFASYILFQQLITKNSFAKKALSSLGKISIEIYALHVYFFTLTYCAFEFFGLNHFRTLISFLVALAGSILIQWLMKKNSILSVIFFGKPKLETDQSMK